MHIDKAGGEEEGRLSCAHASRVLWAGKNRK